MQQYFGISKQDDKIKLNSKDFNHIKNVMRMKANEEVFVVFENRRYICLLSDDLKSATVKEELELKTKSRDISLYIPVLQENKMDLILQKGTELGATKFIPVQFKHCKFKLNNEKSAQKKKRWENIVLEAAEQTMRNDIPVVEDISFVKEIQSVKGMNIICSLYKNGVKNIAEALNQKKLYGNITVVFGPEGGISEDEENMIIENGFERVSLGDNVFRTETVPLYILSVIKYLEGSE